MMKSSSINRFTMVGGALSLAGLFIFVWMIRIQTSPSAQTLVAKAEREYTYISKTIYPERGNIYDRWGRLLAGNHEVYELGVDTTVAKDPQTIALTVSNITGQDHGRIYYLLTEFAKENNLRYVVLANSVPPDQIAQIQAVRTQLREQALQASSKKQNLPSLEGVTWTPYLQRSYPEKELGSTILGFYSYMDRVQGQGYFGVEEKYNHLLSGTPMEVLIPRDPYMIDKPPVVPPGVSLVLTIDREIQAMAEQVIDDAVNANGAASGTVLIMDPRNGEMLAIATTPRMDPNKYWEQQEIFVGRTPFNRAVGETYESGSVFKVLTMAAGLDSGAVSPETVFLDTGIIYVGGIPIYNWDRGAWGPQDMKGCMQHSLNVCLAWIAEQMGPTTFYNYLQRFGIGHMTGIDLAGEVNFPLTVHGDAGWYPINLGTNSFGQGVATTPIQMITAIAAVANDGKMMSPHVLRSIIEEGEQYNNPPQVIGTPISAETARTLTEMLAQSLESESPEATIEGYRLAGKTGTAQIPSPQGYLSSLTNASFVGWGPVDDPRFIVYLWLEKPTTSPWASVVAAPIFGEIAQKLVILLDLPPDDIRRALENQ
jgi:cell division protein FtsI/penicillin-binding protein 2